jgi:hypothetical protein
MSVDGDAEVSAQEDAEAEREVQGQIVWDGDTSSRRLQPPEYPAGGAAPSHGWADKADEDIAAADVDELDAQLEDEIEVGTPAIPVLYDGATSQ